MIFLFLILFHYLPESSPDFTSFTTTEDRRTDTTIPDTTRHDKDMIVSSSGTTALQETTHAHTTGISSTTISVGSSSTSTSLGTTSSVGSSSSSSTAGTTLSTHRTTAYVPPQTDTTIPYIIKETIPPESSTTDHDSDNEILHPDHSEREHEHTHENEEYYDPTNHIPDTPIERETDPPPPIFRTPPPYNPNPPSYNNIPTIRSPPKNKHGRINTEAEERTAMIIGIVAGALIAVILVILLVLWIKSNGDRSYKMEHDLKYGHGANAALLGNAGHPSHGSAHPGGGLHAGDGHHVNNQHNNNNQQYGQQGNGYNNGGGQNYDAHGNEGAHHGSNMGLNGSLRQHGSQHSDRNGMSAGLVQPKAKRNSKDIKEWYV